MKISRDTFSSRNPKKSLIKILMELIPAFVILISFFLYLTNQDKRISVNEANLQAIINVNQSQDVHLQHIESEIDEIYKLLIQKDGK